eukprot:1705831-Pleurochrysis_carterae.AAC.1
MIRENSVEVVQSLRSEPQIGKGALRNVHSDDKRRFATPGAFLRVPIQDLGKHSLGVGERCVQTRLIRRKAGPKRST